MVDYSCQDYTKDGAIAMDYINAASNLLTGLMIMTGVPFPITWKLIDISQLFSLYYYSAGPDF